MQLRIRLQREGADMLKLMAHDAGVGVGDMAEVLIYAGLGGWLRDKEVQQGAAEVRAQVARAAHGGVLPGRIGGNDFDR